jgi:hypothetical protein
MLCSLLIKTCLRDIVTYTYAYVFFHKTTWFSTSSRPAATFYDVFYRFASPAVINGDKLLKRHDNFKILLDYTHNRKQVHTVFRTCLQENQSLVRFWRWSGSVSLVAIGMHPYKCSSVVITRVLVDVLQAAVQLLTAVEHTDNSHTGQASVFL